MVVRANEANRTVPKTNLVVPVNLGRAFLATERFTSPLETGKRTVFLADVLVSNRMPGPGDENIVVGADTCQLRSGGAEHYASID